MLSFTNRGTSLIGCHRCVRRENFQKVAEALSPRLFAKRAERAERGMVELDIVVERDRIEPEVNLRLASGDQAIGIRADRLVDDRRAKRARWLIAIRGLTCHRATGNLCRWREWLA